MGLYYPNILFLLHLYHTTSNSNEEFSEVSSMCNLHTYPLFHGLSETLSEVLPRPFLQPYIREVLHHSLNKLLHRNHQPLYRPVASSETLYESVYPLSSDNEHRLLLYI